MASPLLGSDPRQLGAYWLAGRIGAGGQGVVYEGYDADGRRVAVKALHADFLTEGYRDMLRKEVRALQQVSSFCTARVLATDFDHVPPYVVSEYVPGPTLQARVEEYGPYGPDELHRLAIGIATALAAIHGAGVIHRDLKPANVLLGPDGPRVIDFGIARTEEMSRSATGMLKGTPRWMAPELFRGQRATPAVDVWAWGAIVLYAATGRPPFDGESLPSLMHQVLNRTPETHVLSEPLRSLVERALSQDPDSRPGAGELLKGLLGGTQESPLEAGQQAAAEIAPDTTIPPSLAEVCEEAYQSLEPSAQEAVPRVLLRLVSVRANAEDTVRRAALDELRDEADEQTLTQVLQVLSEAAVIHEDGGTFSLATPALLRAWPRLRDWVEAERDGLDVHHALADSARFWDEHGRKNSDLYQGSALDRALVWTAAERRHLALNTLERDFLDSALALTRRRGRSRTLVIAALSFLLVLALGATAFSVVQNNTVSRQRDEALAAKVANLALSMRRTDPETARRLAIVAGGLDQTGVDTRSALVALYHQWERYAYDPPEAHRSSVVVSDRTGSLLAYNVDNGEQGEDLKIVDVDGRREVQTLRPPGGIGYISMAADGKSVSVTEVKEGLTRIWDVATGQPGPQQFTISSGPAELSDQGGYLIWVPSEEDGNKDVRNKTFVYDTGNGGTVLKLPFRAEDWVFSPNEKALLTVRDKVRLEVWDLATGKGTRMALPLGGDKTPITNLAFSPNARFLAFRQEADIKVIDLEAGKVIMTLQGARVEGATPQNIVFSSDGSYLASAHRVWRISERAPLTPLLRYESDLCGLLRFGPDDRSLRCVDTDHTALEIDISAATAPRELVPERAFVDAQISADGSVLLVSSTEGVTLWDPVRGTEIGELPFTGTSPYDHHYRFSDDGELLLESGPGGEMSIWDVKTRNKKSSWTVSEGFQGAFLNDSSVGNSARFSPDGKTLVLWSLDSGKAVLQFREVDSGKLLREVTSWGNIGKPTLPFTRDGRSIVVGSGHGVVEFPSGRISTPSPTHFTEEMIALSPDDELAVAVKPNRILFYDAETLRHRFDLRAPGVGGSAAFSRDGGVLATSDDRGQIRLWDVDYRRSFGLPLTGARVESRDGEFVQALAFSPDGTSVLSVDKYGHLRDHLVDPARIKKALCDRVGSLSREDWETYIPELSYRETC